MCGHVGHGRQMENLITLADEEYPNAKAIGWGNNNPRLTQTIEIKQLRSDQRDSLNHFDKTKTQKFLNSPDYPALHIDQYLGISFEDVEKFPMREQRKIICERAKKV